MLQKYLIELDNKKERLSIKEYGELDKGLYTLLCEQHYDSAAIAAAIALGKEALIGALRTRNLYPIRPNMERLARSVATLYASSDLHSVEVAFDDKEIFLIPEEDNSPLSELEEETEGEEEVVDDLLADDGK
jgi:hypothetical protein